MNDIKCEVIQDLLPLYVDEVCSDESKKIVDKHLEQCEVCKSMYNKMKVPVQTSDDKRNITDKKSFKSIYMKLLIAIVTLSVAISSYFLNLVGAWMGDKAQWFSVIVTLIFISVMSIFIVVTKRYKPFVVFSFVFTLILLCISLYGLACITFGFGSFISALFVSIIMSPLYGLNLWDWNTTYILASLVCSVWFVYSCMNLKKINASS